MASMGLSYPITVNKLSPSKQMPTQLVVFISMLGGRQVDGAIPTLLALETIMKSPTIKAAQSSGQLTILFDSGIRTGSDIIKALALGAQAVLRKHLLQSNRHLTNTLYTSGQAMAIRFDRCRPSRR